ncbi:MAG: carboxypeptidase-like regulatory domain-containing protein, partial [Niastella sp.]|uniref:carboxypeptidase-like regulatory domain-containing protein n=1 Tax=Niastella sp. TaxID=1869183 RepID=UPI00389AE95D
MVHTSIYKNIVKTGSVLFLALLYIAWPDTCLAQTAVTGTVVDDHGYPIQGALVHLKGEKYAQVTNKDGVFELTATPGAVLVFEYPGYNTIAIKAGSRQPLFVRLSTRYLQQTVAPQSNTLPAGDTIYIPNKAAPDWQVLYGQTNASSFLGSIATIGVNQLGATPASSYTYALPGRLTGLNVMQTSGFYTPLTGSLTSRDIFVGNIPNNTSGAGPTDNTEFNIQLRG